MRHKIVGLVWLCGFSGLLSTASAQSLPPPVPVTKYDGTYAFVSSTKVNETYTTTGTAHIKPCRDLAPRSSLTIVNGYARYNLQQGTVSSQGELTTRYLPTPANSGFVLADITTSGKIDGNGTVRARRIGYNCSYDLVWQKVSK